MNNKTDILLHQAGRYPFFASVIIYETPAVISCDTHNSKSVFLLTKSEN